MAAPSASNHQPWEFYVVTNREKIEALSRVTRYSGCAAGAPAVIVPVYRTETRAPAYCQIDMSIALENLWLACAGLGLGGVWLGIAPYEEKMQAVEKILDIPPGSVPSPCFRWVTRLSSGPSRIVSIPGGSTTANDPAPRAVVLFSGSDII